MADRIYSEQEAQEILSLATRRATSDGGMTRERLIQAASELGIDPEMVLAAEREVLAKQGQRDLRQQYVADCRKRFFSTLSSNGGTCVLLFGINLLTTGGYRGLWSMWAIWPCFFIMLHILKEGREYLTAATPMGDSDFDHWCEHQQKRQKVSEWIDAHPDAALSVKVARLACVEFDAEHKDHAVDKVHRETGLRRRDAKELVNAIYREMSWGTPVEHQDPKWATLQKAKPAVSPYEAARTALDELGPGRRLEAIELVRARTGIDRREAEEAVQAVSELSL